MLLLSMTVFQLYSQHSNEFYIKGAHVTIQSGAKLHVQGDVHLDEGGGQAGRLNNDGVLELRGDFYVNSDNVEQTNEDASPPPLSGLSTGVVRFKNSGFTPETIHEDQEQTIYVFGASSISGAMAFANLEIENENTGSGATSDNYVEISGGDVEVKNTLNFKNDSRIRTYDGIDPIINELYLKNEDPLAIVNPSGSASAGARHRYIDGKFSRDISGMRAYYFPIGFAPGSAGTDGMEAFEITTTSDVAKQKIETYIESAAGDGSDALLVPQLYCDIGKYDIGWTQPWSTCVDGPDGTYDFAHLSLETTHVWSITNGGATITYNLEVFPGDGLDILSADNSCPSTPVNPYNIRFLVKNQALMDGGSIGGIIDAPHPFSTVRDVVFPIGYDLCPPDSKLEGNRLYNQNSFSRFRLYGAPDDQTILPAELVQLTATPVDNRFIRVDWQTASEVNNDGFELQRSTDGVSFETIGWIEGHGTTADPHDYSYDDAAVNKGIVYYYRLRQFDFDGTYEYSDVVNARLTRDGGNIALYPNPVLEQDAVLEMFTPEDVEVDILILNAIGQEIIRDVVVFQSGQNQYRIGSHNLSAGTYIVNAYWNDELFSEKLIVLKNR
ncbi:MAG: T9SS type A sorting domain-containing protein [Bacteroidetes bacterium]|nr:T9SS type A sorting domain-containing protein [Bacteroidota bacterium]